MRKKTIWAGAVLGVVLAACASGGGASSTPAASGGNPQANTQGSTRNANIITADELNAEPASNLYEAIQRLRPQMLVARSAGSGGSSRGGASRATPNVYRDNTKLGDVNALKDIDIRGIKEVHYYSPQDAQTKFSSPNPGGAIQVVTR
jgi:hypothetical protein